MPDFEVLQDHIRRVDSFERRERDAGNEQVSAVIHFRCALTTVSSSRAGCQNCLLVTSALLCALCGSKQMKATPPFKIISGGQTGVDRAALKWAVANGVAHGGWCPKGRKAEDGIIPRRFRLKETGSANYLVRTRRNVRDSHGTVIFSNHVRLSGGTRKTALFAKGMGRPLLRVTCAMDMNEAAARLAEFVKENRIRVLNVAGPRESEEAGVAPFVRQVLTRVFRRHPSKAKKGNALRRTRNPVSCDHLLAVEINPP